MYCIWLHAVGCLGGTVGAGYTSSPDAMQADLTRGGGSSDGTDSGGGAGRWFEGGWDPEPEPEPSDGGSGASLLRFY